ncbi:MAG TPA: flagellar hook protein [Porticoccaceae bacterium]|nr:flagellar hook protein [Porticoccaceae bacterium]
MAITASGLGSGLDIDGLVAQLVAAERTPADNRLLKNEARLQAELSAFGSLKGALSTLQSSLSGLLSTNTFQARNAKVSNSDIFTATAGAEATVGSYDIEVTQLAKTHSLASGVYNAITDVVGEGEITFRFGTTDYDAGSDTYNGFVVNSAKTSASITIDSGNNTLEGIRDAVNNAGIDVTAAIVNDGTGYRLLFSSSDTGAENSLEISVVESGTAGLGQLAFNATETNLTQTVAAQDAQLTINGLAITSASNTVSGAIQDVNLTLQSVTTGTPVGLTIERDRAGVQDTITEFIDAYNSFVETINSLSSFNTDTLEAGILLGDFTLNSVTGKVRAALTGAVGGSAALQRLADIGITTETDGTLSLDNAILDGVFDKNFDDLVGLFASGATVTDSAISFVSSTEKTVPGDYAINVTQLATQGAYQGAGVLPDFSSASVTIDSNNDTLSLKVDGVTSGVITLTAGSYTSGAALAAEVQARINADSALADAGVSVTVAYDSVNNRLEVNSASYGSGSTVEITQVDTNTAATLGLAVGAGIDGLNVAGTIGGVTAIGSGQTLTGALGSATEGLAISVTGGATGLRGSISFNDGVAGKLDELLDAFLGADSVLDLRTESLSDQIDDLADQREKLELRMESFESRTRAKFTALDVLLSQLLQTSDFLAQQLNTLPGAISQGNGNS